MIVKIGNEISSAAKEEDLDELNLLVSENKEIIPFMKIYIDDIFD